MKVFLKAKTVKRYLIKEKELQDKEIKKLRMLYSASRNGFARRLRISSTYISYLMRGLRNPSLKLRERIMKIMPEYKWDDLFKIEE